MKPVIQNTLPYAPWSDLALSRLPGLQPLDPSEWLLQDEAFAGQMALRDQLIRDRRPDVLQVSETAMPAAEELLDAVLTALSGNPEYKISANSVVRPDGVDVPIDRSDPLATAGRLIQEDLCLLVKSGPEHVLTGAVLCFPASWTLSEKFMHPLVQIHEPVLRYDADMAKRVQRLFDRIRADVPMWRANALLYADPSLHTPRLIANRRCEDKGKAKYLRSERQCLVRLPKTGAVVFSIHTYIVPLEKLPPDDVRAMMGRA